MRLVLIFSFIGGTLAAQDPVPSPVSGKEMFLAYCAVCHGVDGKGQGPVASALKRRPWVDVHVFGQFNGEHCFSP